MPPFCVDRLVPERSLRPEYGILRERALRVTSDARCAAAAIVQQAESEASRLLQEARDAAQAIERDAERQVLQRADELLRGLARAEEALLERVQPLVVELAKTLFDRLVDECTPRERVAASLKRIVAEAPPKLADAVLRVHPEDAGLAAAPEWEIKPDPAIGRGACKLEASAGEWHAAFDAAAAAVRDAFAQAAARPAAAPEPDDE